MMSAFGLSRHRLLHCTCPLLGVKQTCCFARRNVDPKRTWETLLAWSEAQTRGIKPNDHRDSDGNYGDADFIQVRPKQTRAPAKFGPRGRAGRDDPTRLRCLGASIGYSR